MSSTPPCRLCMQPKPLQDSHVLPELVWSPLYKGGGTDHWTVGAFRNAQGVLKPRKVQLGLREPLLCRDCEQLFSREYEGPSTGLWRHLADGAALPMGITSRSLSAADGNTGTRFDGVCYRSWKLFLLSLLWRASVAGGPEWSGVDLGTTHEPIIGAMLLKADPRAQGDYPCIIYRARTQLRMIMLPSEARSDGHRCYVFPINRAVLNFLVSGHLPAEMQRHGIETSGSFLVMDVDQDQVPGMDGVRELAKEMGDLPPKMR